jgi:uncharacterized protein YecT (DUF1311 family)
LLHPRVRMRTTIGPLLIVTALLSLMSIAPRAAAERLRCNLDIVPLSRCAVFDDYLAADRKLNLQYGSLIKKLAAPARALLRTRQREWITFRDKKCDEVQVAAKCDNGMCDGVAHDDCMLDLTKIRTAELASFASRAASDFAFDKEYPKPTNY